MAQRTQQAEVVRIRDLSPHVRELVVRPLERPIAFAPGQWVSVHLPVGHRPPLVRAYSMAEPPQESGELVLVFDRVPGGHGSEYLWARQRGDRLPVSGPLGNFVLPEPLTRTVVFFARYTGIVPIRCMIRQLGGRTGADWSAALLYAAPARDELIYHDEFQTAADRYASFTYLPRVGGGGPESEAQAAMEDFRRVVGSNRDVLPMISGVKAFVQPLRALLAEMGYGRREIRVEKYD